MENIRPVDSGVFLRVPKRRGDMPIQERSSGIRSHHPFPLSLGCLFTFPFEHISLWLWETHNPPALSKKHVAVAQPEIETRFLPPSPLLYHLQIRPSLNLRRKARQKPTVYQQSACITPNTMAGLLGPPHSLSLRNSLLVLTQMPAWPLWKCSPSSAYVSTCSGVSSPENNAQTAT